MIFALAYAVEHFFESVEFKLYSSFLQNNVNFLLAVQQELDWLHYYYTKDKGTLDYSNRSHGVVRFTTILKNDCSMTLLRVISIT